MAEALLYIVRPHPATSFASSLPDRTVGRAILARTSRPLLLLIASALPAAMLVASTGARLLNRQTYLFPRDHLLVVHSLGSALALPAAAISGALLFSLKTLKHKLYATLLLLLYSVIFFSLGTRALASMPILLLLGSSFAHDRPRPRLLLKGACAGFASLFLLQIPLTVRALPRHGLVPYTSFLWHHPQRFASPSLAFLSQNILFSYPLTGFVGFRVPALPINTLIVSVNPMPGGAASWYTIADTLRVNRYTPYNALGELTNHGWVFLIAYFTMAGILLAHFDALYLHFKGRVRVIVRIVALAISLFFVLTSLQYNLRTGTRLLYYGLILDIFLLLIIRIPATGVSPDP